MVPKLLGEAPIKATGFPPKTRPISAGGRAGQPVNGILEYAGDRVVVLRRDQQQSIRDSKGDAQFIGETQIGDIAAGGKVDATVSEAFDIEVQLRLVSDERLGSDRRRRSVEYKLPNASAADVSVEVEEGRLGPNVKVVSESAPGVALDVYRRQWTMKVPAKGPTTLTVAIEQDS